MTKLNLLMHCGGSHVDVQQIHDTQTPDATETWHPVPHQALLTHVRKHLEDGGLEVVEEAHGLSADRMRYFGMLQVTPALTPMEKMFGHKWPHRNKIESEDDFSTVVGIRNAHDQSFAINLAIGGGVFVCDNLCFDGEIRVARKHTRHVMRDLERLTAEAVGKLVAKQHDLAARYQRYQQTEIGDSQANDLLIRCLQARALPATKIPGALKEWQTPRHPEFASQKTVWRLFNAITQQYHGSNPTVILRRSLPLQGVMDQACSLVS